MLEADPVDAPGTDRWGCAKAPLNQVATVCPALDLWVWVGVGVSVGVGGMHAQSEQCRRQLRHMVGW